MKKIKIKTISELNKEFEKVGKPLLISKGKLKGKLKKEMLKRY
jgi:hypothetical protein